MKTHLYAVYDSCAEVFHRPFVETNDATAIRVFKDAMLQDKNSHKDDYHLYVLAEYTDHDGLINLRTPTRIFSGLEVKSNITGSDLEE